LFPRVLRLASETAEMIARLGRQHDQGESAVHELQFTSIVTLAPDPPIGLGEP